MRLSGRRLTVFLSTLFVVVLIAGATAAWSFGRHRIETAGLRRRLSFRAHRRPDRRAVRATHRAIPGRSEVRVLLQHYFDSINNRDYDAWMGAVAHEQSAPQTEENWARDYATTVDSNLTVVTVADEPLRARLMFTSSRLPNWRRRRCPSPVSIGMSPTCSPSRTGDWCSPGSIRPPSR